MKRIMKKRNGYISNYIHTASKKIIDIALKEDVKTIVIGDFKTIKSGNKIKYFVQIPHSSLIKQIQYKGKLQGIGVVLQNESYTSSVSSLDLESVNKSNSNKSRRFVRGLFKSSYGNINSDINGSLNILRKYTREYTREKNSQANRISEG
jgi:IS605 OrfB family transposase